MTREQSFDLLADLLARMDGKLDHVQQITMAGAAEVAHLKGDRDAVMEKIDALDGHIRRLERTVTWIKALAIAGAAGSGSAATASFWPDVAKALLT